MPYQLHILPRAQAKQAVVIAAPFIAAALTMLCALVFFAAMGKDPLRGFSAFFIDPIANIYRLGDVILKAAPLCLIALGLTPGFRTAVWNIGAEGQLVLGAIAASYIAILFDGEKAWWILPLMIMAGGLAGAAWASIVAFLRTRFNANEILVSLMLVYIAILFLTYLVYGPLKNPNGMGFPQTILFSDSAVFGKLFSGLRINTSLILVLLAIPIFYLFLERSFIGYQLQVGGLAPNAAQYAGFSSNRSVWLALLIGGFCAGMAGVMEVAGPMGQMTKDVPRGYGFAAIIVAFLGRLNPFGIVFASLLMSMLYIGGEKVQISMQLPSAITGIFQGCLLFFLLACDFFANNSVNLRKRSAAR